MKKTLLVLAVLLLAVPAGAAVNIWCTVDACEVTVYYDANDEPNLVRAYALDIFLDNDTNIVSVSNYHVGDSTSSGKGYGIFPGGFGRLDETDPGFPLWADPVYTPVAYKSDYPSDTLAGLDSNGISVEMGSLYYPVTGVASPNAPPKAGVLLQFLADEAVGTVTIRENATRAGVVMENPDQAVDVNCTACSGECFPSGYTTYNDWVTLGRPDCWCAPYQCDGDADGATETLKKYRIYSGDAAVISANWKKLIDDVTLDPCADIDHKKETLKKYRVYSNDIAVVSTNWKATDGDLPGNCPRPE